MIIGLRKVIITIFVSGIIYDVIVEPPSIGSTTDERGNSKPVSCLSMYVYLKYGCVFLKPDKNYLLHCTM